MYQTEQPDLPVSQPWYRNQYFVLFLVWLVPTIININKAFHIDDAFHLEVAKWIVGHPLTPMSGTVNWYNDPEPFSNANQPPLYFYLLAIWGKIFGFSEIMLHLLQSVFTFLCIVFFFKIVRLFNKKNAIALTVIFAFNPAFIVNQNLMTDIPLLSALLAFIYALVKPQVRSDMWRYVTAALILSVGLLIKYSLLPLTLVLLLAIVYQKNYRYLFVVLIPFFFLALWSVWNYYEFGSVHLLNRGGGTSIERIAEKGNALILCIGAIAFFPLFILHGISRSSKVLSVVVMLASTAIPVFAILVYFDIIPEKEVAGTLGIAFLINGIITLFAVFYSLFLYVSGKDNMQPVIRQMAIVYFWLVGITLFIIGFAPFIATRHVLLVLPAVLIVTSVLWEKTPAYIKTVVLVGTVLSGVVLGISDWQFADYYRRAASDVKAQVVSGKKWSAGHWGWQWYCSKENIETLGMTTSKLTHGDYLVTAKHIAKQDIHLLNLTRVKSFWYTPGISSFFSVSKFAGFYATSSHEFPWTLSKEAIDTIVIYRINK